eukprot:scaffold7351_cov259-Pinguiococcus_pyrenoidosus.AAC.12
MGPLRHQHAHVTIGTLRVIHEAQLVALQGRVQDGLTVEVEEVASILLVVDATPPLGFVLADFLAPVLPNEVAFSDVLLAEEAPTGSGHAGRAEQQVLLSLQTERVVLTRVWAARARAAASTTHVGVTLVARSEARARACVTV